MVKLYKKYFRGDEDNFWPKGSVYLDTGFRSAENFEIRLEVGSCSMVVTPEIATEILIAVSAAEKERRKLVEESKDE